MEFHYFRAGDNQLLRYSISKPRQGVSRGCLLFLNGRSEFMEKYESVVEQLVSRGFFVVSLDWRGQGLSVRELENPDKGYIRSFQCYLDDLALFFMKVIKPLGLPVTILSHSMGGHIALRSMARREISVKNAILLSPMVDIVTAPIPRYLAGVLARQMVKRGKEEMYIPGNGDYSKDTFRFKNNPLTHDFQGFMQEHRCIEKNRDLALGGVTWGWVNAAFDSIDALENTAVGAGIIPPVLLLSAADDRVVSSKAQKKLCRRLSRCAFISVPGARHEILNESPDVIAFFWKMFDRFTA